MKIIDVWINCPDIETAENIATQLVAQRLAACSNLFSPVKSSYHWKGTIENASEIPLLIKTRESLFEAVCKHVSQVHPYDVPGIMAVVVEHVNEDYRQWVYEQTMDPEAV